MLSARLAAFVSLLLFASAASSRPPAAAGPAPLPMLIAAASGATAEHGKPAPAAHKKRSKKAARILRGEASWYGLKLAGKKTASGERFSPKAMTAAHPSLPFGTKVRVTNVDNRKSAVLTINDRLPRKHGRLIDVTKAAAKKLGFVEDGTTPVRVKVLRRGAK